MLFAYLFIGALVAVGMGALFWFILNFERDSKKFYKDYLKDRQQMLTQLAARQLRSCEVHMRREWFGVGASGNSALVLVRSYVAIRLRMGTLWLGAKISRQPTLSPKGPRTPFPYLSHVHQFLISTTLGSSLRIDNNIKIEQSVVKEFDKTVIKIVITVQNNLSDGDD